MERDAACLVPPSVPPVGVERWRTNTGTRPPRVHGRAGRTGARGHGPVELGLADAAPGPDVVPLHANAEYQPTMRQCMPSS